MTEKVVKQKKHFSDPKVASEAGKKSSKKGKLHKSTLIKMNLAEHLQDFDGNLYEQLMAMLNPVEAHAGDWTKDNVEKAIGKKLDPKAFQAVVQAVSNSIKYQIVNDIETKKFVIKELLKYRVPQKREITGNVYGQIIFQAHPDILSGDEESFANPSNPEG